MYNFLLTEVSLYVYIYISINIFMYLVLHRSSSSIKVNQMEIFKILYLYGIFDCGMNFENIYQTGKKYLVSSIFVFCFKTNFIEI